MIIHILSKNVKIIFFSMNFSNSTAENIVCILHGHVFVMDLFILLVSNIFSKINLLT